MKSSVFRRDAFHMSQDLAGIKAVVALFFPIPFIMASGPGLPIRIVVKVAFLS